MKRFPNIIKSYSIHFLTPYHLTFRLLDNGTGRIVNTRREIGLRYQMMMIASKELSNSIDSYHESKKEEGQLKRLIAFNPFFFFMGHNEFQSSSISKTFSWFIQLGFNNRLQV